MSKRTPLIGISLFVATLALTLSPSAGAATLHVPAEYATIQAGIIAAEEGDTVLVADGTYTGNGNRDIYFLGKGITVRSANGPETCILDCEGSFWELHRGFIFHSDETGTSVLQGFTIHNANVAWFGEYGGGIYCINASPTIIGNIFSNCEARQGGGIFCENGSPLILNNTFTANRAYDLSAPAANGRGAAISIQTGSAPLVKGNSFSWCMASGRGGAIFSWLSSPVITENRFDNNWTSPASPDLYGDGGAIAIYCWDEALVTDNQIDDCSADLGGGIVSAGSVVIARNTFEGNHASSAGGAICGNGAAQVRDNVLTDNSSGMFWEAGGIHLTGEGGLVSGCTIIDSRGSGISCHGVGPFYVENTLLLNNHVAITTFGRLVVRSCTITGTQGGYGQSLRLAGNTTITDSILWDNAPANQVILVEGTLLSIDHTDIEGGRNSIELTEDSALNWGAGMIDADPLFVSGVEGERYLSQTAAGQPVDSPCVDTGSDSAVGLGLDVLSTRTDLLPDMGIVDMGYHYPAPTSEPDTVITGGPDGTTDSPVVCFSFAGIDGIDPPSFLFSHRLDAGPWSDYSGQTDACYEEVESGNHTFEVRCRDSEGNVDPTPAQLTFASIPWDNSGWTGLVTGPGPGPLNPPLVRTPLAQWTAYGVFRHGVNVACGDLDGDGTAEVVTGPGPGPDFGPHVRGWELDGTVISGVNYLAYGTLKYGANVACGDLDGDGFAEIVTGAGPGAVFGPHVRGWNHDGGGSTTSLPGVSFFAYGTLKYGVNVACGDLDGDGFDEIVTGAGPGAVFGPHVRAWNWDGGGNIEPVQDISYFAYGTLKWGVNVACGDLDGDGMDEIITGPGPSALFGAHVRAWNCDGGPAVPMPGINFFAYSASHGCVVGAGDVDGDAIDEILTMPGPGPENTAWLQAWNADDGSISPVPGFDFFAYDSWFTHGGRVAGTVMASGRRDAPQEKGRG